YIGLRRGDRVQVEGEFSEHMEEERRERVFQVVKISSLETQETWRFTHHNWERFLAIYGVSFIIILTIAVIVANATTTYSPDPFIQTILIPAIGNTPGTPTSSKFLVALYLFNIQQNIASGIYQGAFFIAAFLALFPSTIMEGTLTRKECYEKGTVEVSPPKENICMVCGAKVPEELDACLECGEIMVKCVLCKSHIAPKEACFCPHCNSPFHRDHLLEWIKIWATCPHCGTKLSKEELHQQQ
ncbi:MAG: hypothetical protein KIH09_05850, partial [Candidatus Freyarchaeota archaeon]|nr:hypothetical protein [Candidatus Jordarchaeia archaeon]